MTALGKVGPATIRRVKHPSYFYTEFQKITSQSTFHSLVSFMQNLRNRSYVIDFKMSRLFVQPKGTYYEGTTTKTTTITPQ